jgi:hypothetical protein
MDIQQSTTSLDYFSQPKHLKQQALNRNYNQFKFRKCTEILATEFLRTLSFHLVVTAAAGVSHDRTTRL